MDKNNELNGLQATEVAKDDLTKEGKELTLDQVKEYLTDTFFKCFKNKYKNPQNRARLNKAFDIAVEASKEKPGWISVDDRIPNVELPQEIEVIGFNPEWIHEDFNPNGTRMCSFTEDQWNSAEWDSDSDCYVHTEQIPTHWLPLPLSPLLSK